METPYKAVSFERNDIVTIDALDQLQANNQWIHDNTPRGRFYRGDTHLDVRSVIIGGRVNVPANNKSPSARVPVKFGKAFKSECRPHVTTGIISDKRPDIFCVINGPNATDHPTDVGFDVVVLMNPVTNKEVIKNAFAVAWHAFGYRDVNVNEF